MDFKEYRRLEKLAKKVSTFSAFLEEVSKAPSWYGIPLWNKEDYIHFYERIKGESNHDCFSK